MSGNVGFVYLSPARPEAMTGRSTGAGAVCWTSNCRVIRHAAKAVATATMATIQRGRLADIDAFYSGENRRAATRMRRRERECERQPQTATVRVEIALRRLRLLDGVADSEQLESIQVGRGDSVNGKWKLGVAWLGPWPVLNDAPLARRCSGELQTFHGVSGLSEDSDRCARN